MAWAALVRSFAGRCLRFVRGVVISAVIVLALAAFAPQWGWLQQSRIAPFMLVTGRALIWAAPAELRQRFWDGWNLLRSVPEHISDPVATTAGKLEDMTLWDIRDA